ncbi:MAG: prephenate dehydrogenase [Actinomycetota bacterium]|nr:prephenate dehydrogenase [Actinomycetota bacterium]
MGFRRIAIVGVGLMGGSFAAASKALPSPPQVFGVDPDTESLSYARGQHIIDDAATPQEAIEQGWFGPGGVDLVVLATPARVAEEWLRILGENEFDGVVTDVSSTKGHVIDAAERFLGDAAAFVGGHPMAGSERSGVEAARADLFAGAYYVLTPTPTTDMDAYRRLHSYVASLGARVVSVDAREHDEAVAIISHVPHVTASALVELAKAHAGEGDELLRLAAGGFKDTTRIAAGSADLWTGICIDNAPALSAGIDELREVLGEFAEMLRTADTEAIRDWLARAADVRRSLPAQWVPATEALSELLIPVIDRPGVISEVTSAVGRARCNIEAIEIDHQSEDSAVLVLVLTDEGDMLALTEDLRSRGYDPRLRPLDAGTER